MDLENMIALHHRRLFTAQLQRRLLAVRVQYDLNELEYSEYGRDPRLLPEWWIVPMCFVTVISFQICLSGIGG